MSKYHNFKQDELNRFFRLIESFKEVLEVIHDEGEVDDLDPVIRGIDALMNEGSLFFSGEIDNLIEEARAFGYEPNDFLLRFK